MVKTKNQDQIDMYEIDVLPKLVYFESEIPTFWPDEVTLQVDWLLNFMCPNLPTFGCILG